VAVSRDGTTLLVSDNGGSHTIHEFSVADGSRLRVIGGAGDGPLQFRGPNQVWVAFDDHVFVAEYLNNRVQVLTPHLDFHAFVGVGHLDRPAGVCADDAVVVVAETGPTHRISVFDRRDGALRRRFGSEGCGDGQLMYPQGLCFVSGRHVAVAESYNDRVSVFSVDGKFIHHVGVGKLKCPTGVACSAFDEVVVADMNNTRIAVFSVSGELLKTMGRDGFGGVAIHGGIVFAQHEDKEQCILFK
jgi:tripartite motif-containing protein 71